MKALLLAPLCAANSVFWEGEREGEAFKTVLMLHRAALMKTEGQREGREIAISSGRNSADFSPGLFFN